MPVEEHRISSVKEGRACVRVVLAVYVSLRLIGDSMTMCIAGLGRDLTMRHAYGAVRRGK